MDAKIAAFLIAALAVSSACTRSREDVDGTYVVDGELTIDPRGKASLRTTIAKETITVKLTMRSYQFGSYEMVVRGCKMKGDGTLSPAVVTADACTFDAPSGAVPVRAFGDVTPTKGGGVDIHVRGPMLLGDSGFDGSFDYKVHGVPKGP